MEPQRQSGFEADEASLVPTLKYNPAHTPEQTAMFPDHAQAPLTDQFRF